MNKAGFYIHIPFCRNVCYYCDFHFVASLKYKNPLIKAIIKELELKSKDWDDYNFTSLYFGGGTPSVLSISEINEIVKCVKNNYNLNNDLEFTFEANPDDLTTDYLKSLKADTHVNRLSIGIQSFNDEELKYINRIHNAQQAINSIKNAQKSGFENITIDLMYGIPGQKIDSWRKTLETFINLDINHLSAYHLSVEPKTVFGVFQKRSQIKPTDEEFGLKQYSILTETLGNSGFEHYEISNFAKMDYYSRHNTLYWQSVPYLGIGPSAHSYKKDTRSWNIANNTKYCEYILLGEKYYEEENLTKKDKFNDYILTALRTKKGADFNFIREEFGEEFYLHCINTIKKYSLVNLYKRDRTFALTEIGWFISDGIIADFMYI